MSPDPPWCAPGSSTTASGSSTTAGSWSSTTSVVDGRLRVVVVSDTHLQTVAGTGRVGNPVRGRGLPATAYPHLAGADAILHAGDVLDGGVLDELAQMAPTWAVLGNNDRSLVGALPEARVVTLAGVDIGMIHDAGPAVGRPARLHRRFPVATMVVFGHSHAPSDEVGVAGQVLFNPGSPTQRRAQPRHTLGLVDLDGGRLVGRRIVDLD